jgi:hypothetical protein
LRKKQGSFTIELWEKENADAAAQGVPTARAGSLVLGVLAMGPAGSIIQANTEPTGRAAWNCSKLLRRSLSDSGSGYKEESNVNTSGLVRVVTLLASTLLSTTAFAATKADLEAAMSHDGLQKISVKGIDLAYARPGATLAGYNRIKLDPVDVAFHKEWDPTINRSRLKITAEQREAIRTGVAKIVYEEFAKELQKNSNYQLVNEAGPDVLRVKTNIVNLYVNAPDTGAPGLSRTYTVSAGEMSLIAELYDSETGEVLARVVDRREARRAGTLTYTNSVTNEDDFRYIANGWARILRNSLDKAHGIGKK